MALSFSSTINADPSLLIPKLEQVNCVIVHGQCQDGFGAALAAWLVRGSDGVEYHYLQHGDPVPDVKGKHVVIGDFSFPKDVLVKMQTDAASLIVLDHHKTAMEALKGVPNCVFDMKKSGATMTFEFFHPGQPMPRLFRLIEDRDIWRWTEADSHEFHAGFDMVPKEFEAYKRFVDDPSAIDDLVVQGKAIIKANDAYIRRRAAKAVRRTLLGHRVAVINNTHLTSELGNFLAAQDDVDVAFLWSWDHEKKQCSCSLRSVGDMDASVIASKFGGGGHRNACGFRCDDVEALLEQNP